MEALPDCLARTREIYDPYYARVNELFADYTRRDRRAHDWFRARTRSRRLPGGALLAPTETPRCASAAECKLVEGRNARGQPKVGHMASNVSGTRHHQAGWEAKSPWHRVGRGG
ncbi:hypothetical protein GCM10023238_39220 [Streptomyces heliomycini]